MSTYEDMRAFVDGFGDRNVIPSYGDEVVFGGEKYTYLGKGLFRMVFLKDDVVYKCAIREDDAWCNYREWRIWDYTRCVPFAECLSLEHDDMLLTQRYAGPTCTYDESVDFDTYRDVRVRVQALLDKLMDQGVLYDIVNDLHDGNITKDGTVVDYG